MARDLLTGEEITPQPGGVTAKGVGKAYATGVRSGVEGIPGAGGDVPEMVGRGVHWLSEKTGIGDPNAAAAASGAAVQNVMSPLSGIARVLQMAGIIGPDTAQTATHIAAPSSADVGAVTDPIVSAISPTAQEVTRHKPEPGNVAEETANTAGVFSGAAALPGSLLARIARVLFPTAATETVGQGVRQLAPEYEDAARLVTAVLSGGLQAAGERAVSTRAALSKLGTTPGGISRVRQLLIDEGMTPQEAATKIKELGPEGLLVDVGEGNNLRQEAQRIQAAGGPGRTEINPILRARELGSNRRMMEDVGATVGPYAERDQTINALKQRISEKGVEQAAAAKGGTPADPQFIVDDLDARIQGEKNNKLRSTLSDIRDSLFLRDKNGDLTTQLDTTSEGLLSARQSLKEQIYNKDGSIKEGIGSKEKAILDDYYAKINEALDPANPALRKVDKEIEATAKEMEGFEKGQKVFSKEEGVQGPVSFAQEWGGLSSEEKASAIKGVAAKLYEKLGVFGKDRVQLNNLLVGEGKWPQEKLEIMLGKDKAKQLVDGLNREKTFQETYQKVVQGSKTAETVRQENKLGVGNAVVESAGAAMGGNVPAGVAVGLSHVRRMAQELMARRGATAKDAAVAKLLMSNRMDDIARGIQIMQSRGSVVPPAMLAGLLERQTDVSRRKEAQR